MSVTPRWRWVLPILLGLFLFALPFAPHVSAQTDDKLSGLTISVWPEYDQPSVLVQYDGQVASTEGLPRTVSVLVPSSAKVNAVAYVATNGDLLNTESPTTADAGNGFSRVSFKLPQPKFHLEYYYNPLQGSPDKTMDFTYKSAQTAENVQIEIQQPLKSSNFTTDPASQLQSNDAHGFVYHMFNYATLTPDQEVKIHVAYTRSDTNPSVSSLPTPASAAAPAADAAASSSNSMLIPGLLIAGAFALVALGGLYWWTRNRRLPEPAPVVSESSRRRSRPKSGGGNTAGFCYKCGRALSADDNFCPRCGAPRRKAESQ